jgi:hypothetical protein
MDKLEGKVCSKIKKVKVYHVPGERVYGFKVKYEVDGDTVKGHRYKSDGWKEAYHENDGEKGKIKL